MKLKKLSLIKTKNKNSIIREINFKDGLNLIIDNTIDIHDQTKTGNNIGKTTLIKIIDLCLGAKSIKYLYYDEDTKSTNDIIKNFLEKELVIAELIIENKDKKRYIIQKELFGKGLNKIDNEILNRNKFSEKLKEIIFNSNQEKPTLRQLIPKFVRVSNLSSEKMLKFLERTSNADYEAIYSFLFKLKDEKLISKIGVLEKNIAEIDKKLKFLINDKNISSLPILKQKEDSINKELKKYELNKKKINFLKINKEELEITRALVKEINNIEVEIELIDFEIELIRENIKKLENEKFRENINILENLYYEAQAYIEEIHIKFEELVIFHNSMIDSRKKYISQDLQEKEEASFKLVEKRNILLLEKEKIHNNIFEDENLDNILEITKQYEDLLIEKGEISASIKILENVTKEKEVLLYELQKYRSNELEDNDTNISIFNDIFSVYSQELYSEKYIIAFNPNWKEEKDFPITCDTIRGQIGTGKKKAVIMAFDLAYLQFSNQLDINCPKFVIHDKLENTHINQLKTIFDISQKIDGQLIIPILREKIISLDNKIIDTCKIVELSQENKLFKI